MTTIGSLFRKAWTAFLERWRPLVGIMALELAGRYAVILGAAAAVVLAVLGGAAGLAELETLPDRLQDVTVLAEHIVALVAILLAALLVLTVFEAWVLTSLFFAVERPEAGFAESLRGGWSHAVPFSYVMGLVSVAVLVGLLLFILPGMALAVLFLLAPQAYFVEGRTGWSALTRSREAISGRLVPVAARVVALWAALGAGAWAISLTGVPVLLQAYGLATMPFAALFQSLLFKELTGPAGAGA